MQDETLSNMTSEEQDSLLKLATETFKAEVKTYSLRYDIPILDDSLQVRCDMVRLGARRLAFSFIHQVYCLGEKSHTVEFNEPATWVDALKLEYRNKLPLFISKRIKVNYKKLSHTVTARALLPDLPIADDHSIYYVARHDRSLDTSL
jgi:hypothetical protein